MNTYHHALIDYWLEIGKLKRVRSRCFKNIETGEIRENPASPWLYIFVREDGIELPMRNLSWRQFFESFTLFNHVAFQCEINPSPLAHFVPNLKHGCPLIRGAILLSFRG